MRLPDGVTVNPARLLKEWLGLIKPPHAGVEAAEVAQICREVRVFLPNRQFANLDRLL